jgi:hypothetical protein
MRRRDFITILGGAAATQVVGPGVADAQKAPIRIGFLAAGAAASANSAIQIEAIKRGLRENGLIEDQDYVLDARFPDGNYERFPELAREQAQAGARVILVNTIASVRAAQNLNPPVAVVMLAINDPVRTGLVSSLHKRPFSKTPSPTRRSCLRRCPGHNPNAEISMTRGITCGNKDEPERQHLRKKMQCNARPFRRRFHDAIL